MDETIYRGVNHLAMITDDMDKTVRFYRDVLGMKVVGTVGGVFDGKRMRHYFFSLGPASTIAFFEWPDIELPPRKDSGVPATGRNFDHVSINVESEEVLRQVQERVRSHGVDATDFVDHGMVKSIYFEDPNGISLEFSVWMINMHENPMFKDPEPVAALTEVIAV